MLFNLKSMALPVLIGSTLVLLGGCGSEKAESDPATNQMAQTNGSGEAASFPESLPVFGDGYPQSGAPCRRVGETEVTVDLMDDSADLVACPTKEQARVLGGKIVGLVDGFSLVSVPTGDANAGLPAAASQAKSALAEPPKDVVRGKGRLEEKCLKAVAAQGTKVIGTNRIEESEAATAIYVNVVGGQAPWRCLGYRDGTIGDVMYTGDEGAL